MDENLVRKLSWTICEWVEALYEADKITAIDKLKDLAEAHGIDFAALESRADEEFSPSMVRKQLANKKPFEVGHIVNLTVTEITTQLLGWFIRLDGDEVADTSLLAAVLHQALACTLACDLICREGIDSDDVVRCETR